MNDDEKGGGTKPFAAGLLIGGLIGAGVALLFAPQSGAETRKMIKRKSKRMAASAQDRFEDVKDRIRLARRKAEAEEASD